MPSVTRTASGNRSARRRLIVEKLLGSVEELLESGESYAEISVERLITAAGISRSTFYVYFEDKGVLLLALAEDVVAQLVTAAETWWTLPHEAGREDIEAALRQIADTYGSHAAMWGALVDAAAYDPNVRASFRAVVDTSSKGLERHIRDGQKAGSVRAELDARRTASWLTWMTERGLYQLLPGANAAELQKLCEAQAAIIWFTLYDGSASRG